MHEKNLLRYQFAGELVNNVNEQEITLISKGRIIPIINLP